MNTSGVFLWVSCNPSGMMDLNALGAKVSFYVVALRVELTTLGVKFGDK